MTTDKFIQEKLESLSQQLNKKLDKEVQEQQFAERANLKFEENLLAFKQFFPEIYEKYLTYTPSEKFQFILNENGTANLIDYETGVPMYSDDPIGQAEKQVEKNIDSPHIGRVDHSSVAFLENNTNFIHVDLMKSMGGVFLNAKENLSNNEKLDDVLPSLILFGVGLGYHLLPLLKCKKVNFINILEPNEDYFFASLFVADWKELLQLIDMNGGYLYLGIGKSEIEIFKDIYNRSRDIGIASVGYTWFYQHYPSASINRWIDQFKANFHQLFAGFGFFDDALIGIAHTLGNVESDFNLINSNNPIDKVTGNFPVVIVANGPSLDDSIQVLKEIKNEVIIFSCNSASTALIKHGIIPDFHVALERTESTYKFLKEFLTDEYRSKINLLVTNVMHPKVPELFPWTGFALKGNESGTQLIQLSQFMESQAMTDTISYCNPLVGNTALSFACHLGFKSIYLFGVDNGYVDEAHHHSKSSFYYNNKGETAHQPIKIGKQISVPGNFVYQVLTDEFMSVGITQMEKLLASFKLYGLECYNCSNGAKIEGAMPLHTDSIFIEPNEVTKQSVIEYIKQKKFLSYQPLKPVDELLHFEEFEDFSNTMVSILSAKVINRYEALDTLLKSIRYLYSFKYSVKYLNIFLIMEGEVLYTTSLLISLLYN
ncbi:6-hydroxymethylpterin diphosphokinase MptE-like protein [Pseudoalteromonas sp.]|uniref:motility associated factor glycosyltransferase family protein n=1 Tax=Pseudoalteromonas sp. TaxID=53249 RepID=UPI003511DF27